MSATLSISPFSNFLIITNILHNYILLTLISFNVVQNKKSSFELFGSVLQTGIEILSIPRDLITIIFCYQISLKPLKTLSLSHVSFPLAFPLCYIFPYEFTNSDKGKYKGAGHPVDVRFAPTVAKRRPRKLYNTL